MKLKKTAGNLSGHINIGKDTEKKLKQVGIDSFQKLKITGTEQTFIKLQTIDPGACLSLLCAIEGAIEGIRWHDLSPEKKQELKAFHKTVKKK
jgi:DNA transformation protein and related proteins